LLRWWLVRWCINRRLIGGAGPSKLGAQKNADGTSIMNWAISIDRDRIADAKLVDLPTRPLEDGEARLAVRRFALTANNITYAAFGAVMRYWEFFPGSDGRGRLPVWGFAEIVESRCEGLDAGERLYGYFPAASELIVRPGRITPEAFIDMSPHRAELAAVYNRYVRCAADPGWADEREPAQMVLQPLFVTSFLIAEFLRDEAAFGATMISLTSASSKTALALAYLLKKQPIGGVSLQALTSRGNADFVAGLGLYDDVVVYEDVENLPGDTRYCLIDFAGDGGLNTRLHTHLTDQLMANIRVGGAHWQDSAPVSGLPGPAPQFFFAPDHARERTKAWGPAAFQARYTEDWTGFAGAASSFLDYAEHDGGEGALGVYNALIRGEVPARQAEMIKV
jgi:hypothetical protein